MRLGEYGVELNFAAGMSLTGNTYLALVFTKPSGAQLVRENADLTVGTQDLYGTAGYMPSGTYVRYVFADGELDEDGTWTVKLIFQDNMPRKLISDNVTFTVEA